MQIKRVIWYAVITVTFWTCKDDQPEENMEDLAVIEVAKEHFEFGFNFNDFIVKRDTIKSGDTFHLYDNDHYQPTEIGSRYVSPVFVLTYREAVPDPTTGYFL